MISRRALLRGATALALTHWPDRAALATARVPYGGRLILHVPWPLSSLDPHRVDDATAALFGEALFDTLYGPGEGGTLVPVLAEDDPHPDEPGARSHGTTLRQVQPTSVGPHATLDPPP